MKMNSIIEKSRLEQEASSFRQRECKKQLEEENIFIALHCNALCYIAMHCITLFLFNTSSQLCCNQNQNE